MKKPILVLTAGVLAGVTLLFPACKKKESAAAQAELTTLAPADTAIFVALPDVPRTRERWKQSAVAQILAEPEVKAFLKKPMDEAKAKAGQQDDFFERIKKAQVVRAFVAVKSGTDDKPAVVAGCSVKGAHEDADARLADLKKRLHEAKPAGKADLVKHGEVTVETYTFDGNTVATAAKGAWYLAGNNVDLLDATLDRLDGKQEPSLAGDQMFKDAMAHAPADADAELFVRMGDIVKRLTGVMAMAGRPVQEKQLEELKKLQAVGGAMKFDGPNMRDSLFILRPGAPKDAAIQRSSLALTTKDTLLYYVMRWTMKSSDLQGATGANPALAAILGAVEQTLKAQGVSLAEACEIFGPEFGFVLDWPAASTAPSPVLSLDIKDKAKAAQVVQALTGGALGNAPWDKREGEGGVYFIKTGGPLVTMTPVLALTDKALLFGLSVEAVKTAIGRAGVSGGKLAESPTFQKAEASVAKPQDSFGYADGAALFDRVYAVARPFLMMAPMMAPDLAKHVPLDKLPASETISKHLGPLVYSQSETPDGTLVESAGPVTMNQAFIGTTALACAAAIPLMKNGVAGAMAPGLAKPQIPAPVPPVTAPASTPQMTPEPSPAPSPATGTNGVQ